MLHHGGDRPKSKERGVGIPGCSPAHLQGEGGRECHREEGDLHAGRRSINEVGGRDREETGSCKVMRGELRQCLCCVKCARRAAALMAARPLVACWSQNKRERRFFIAGSGWLFGTSRRYVKLSFNQNAAGSTTGTYLPKGTPPPEGCDGITNPFQGSTTFNSRFKDPPPRRKECVRKEIYRIEQSYSSWPSSTRRRLRACVSRAPVTLHTLA